MIWMIIYIQFWHWVADFTAQTHEMAINKSKSLYWLSRHVESYITYMVLGSMPILAYSLYIDSNYVLDIIYYISFNGIMHWITDYFTSKWSSKLWEKKDVHNFFVVIGLDQLIHSTTLILSFYYLIIN